MRTRALAIAVVFAGCNPPNIAGEDLQGTSTGDAFGGVRCSAVRPQTEPDLMGWDPGSRSNLNRLRHKGVIAVRYQARGCNVELELLSQCIGTTGAYEFSPYSANERKVAHNANELFAQLPIGAARLSGSLKGTRVLRTDYMLAGQHALPPGSTFKAADLQGPDCARATHVVSAVYVGAFAMAAGESRAMEGEGGLLGKGIGASVRSSADVESLGDEGDAEACKTSQSDHKENEGCSVPLRIALLALQQPPQATPMPTTSSSAAPPPPLAPGECPAGMAAIPAGKFMMGAADGPASEKPVHEVEISAFCMDVREVSAHAYRECKRAAACAPADSEFGIVPECNEKAGGKDAPINCITWWGANAYCAWAKKRLPSEEEWEYAARGTDGRKFPWGSAQPAGQLCWNRWLPKRGTCESGSNPADQSPFGLFDMAGNVSEWTASKYSNDYATPLGIHRTSRGGSWAHSDPKVVRATHRQQREDSERIVDLGFRCAR